MEINRNKLRVFLINSLAEDVGPGDVTTRLTIGRALYCKGRFMAREPGVLAGIDVVKELFSITSPHTRFRRLIRDGSSFKAGATLAEASGPAAAILAGERLALNILQHLSGIATLTGKYVKSVGKRVKIMDTRKTTPMMRALEKYAVRMGGGVNHRFGLYDQILIKNNHLSLSGLAPAVAIPELVSRARASGLPVEVEVRGVKEAVAGAVAGADIIMLDNMSPARMKQAAEALRKIFGRSKARPQLEASGNMTPERARRAADCGVDRISIGELTHSARALDIALSVERT